MQAKTHLTSAMGSVVAFVGATLVSAGCIVGTCKGYCDGFVPEIEPGVYGVEIYEETAIDHYATELSEVEITDEQVMLRYVDRDGQPAEVVWDIVRVEAGDGT
jgi:hypothetical protein